MELVTATIPWKTHTELKPILSLGAGSFGQVWKAQHQTDCMQYAVKKVSLLTSFKEFHNLHKWQREVKILSQIFSENVIRYSNSWLEDTDNNLPDLDLSSTTERINGFLFIQMELCDGDLRNWLKFYNPELKSVTQIYDIYFQIANGLEAIHKQNIIHRDLKPANILYKKLSDGKLVWKIGDFGLGLQIRNDDAEKSSRGNRRYCSPEMHQCQSNYTNQTDIYSLGLVFCEIILKPETTVFADLLYELQMHPTDTHIIQNSLENRIDKDCRDMLLEMLSANADDRPIASKIVKFFQLKVNGKKTLQTKRKRGKDHWDEFHTENSSKASRSSTIDDGCKSAITSSLESFNDDSNESSFFNASNNSRNCEIPEECLNLESLHYIRIVSCNDVTTIQQNLLMSGLNTKVIVSSVKTLCDDSKVENDPEDEDSDYEECFGSMQTLSDSEEGQAESAFENHSDLEPMLSDYEGRQRDTDSDDCCFDQKPNSSDSVEGQAETDSEPYSDLEQTLSDYEERLGEYDSDDGIEQENLFLHISPSDSDD